jgi:putative flippase GtrA
MREDAARLFRFGLVGGAAAVIHMAAFEAFRRFAGFGAAAGWGASFVVAATAAWLMNRSFTFRASPDRRTSGEWTRYLVVATLGALAHFAVFLAATAFVPPVAAQPALGIIPGSLASLCVTYVGSSIFVFATARKRP